MTAVTPGQRYAKIAQAFLRRPGVTQHGQGFGASALRIHGKMFATLSPAGAFVVRLPRRRVEALAAAGQGGTFLTGTSPVSST